MLFYFGYTVFSTIGRSSPDVVRKEYIEAHSESVKYLNFSIGFIVTMLVANIIAVNVQIAITIGLRTIISQLVT